MDDFSDLAFDAEAPSAIETAVRKYGPEVFRFLSPEDVTVFLSQRDPERSLSNRQLALLLLGVSPGTRERILNGLDRFRRPVIERLRAEMEPRAGELAAGAEALEAAGRLARGLVFETSYGRIKAPVFPGCVRSGSEGQIIVPRPWRVGDEKPAPNEKGGLRLVNPAPPDQVQSSGSGKDAKILLFDYLAATPDACIGFWVKLHKKMRDAGTAPLEKVIDHLDEFSRTLAIVVLERHDATTHDALFRGLLEAERARMEAYYRRAGVFFDAFEGVDTPTLLERLSAASPGLIAPQPPSLDVDAPLPDIHPRLEPSEHVLALAHLHGFAHAKGLVALERFTDKPEGKCPVMLCGLNVLCTICDPELLREAVRLKTQTLMAEWERRASMVMTALSAIASGAFWFVGFTLMEAHLVQCQDSRDYLR